MTDPTWVRLASGVDLRRNLTRRNLLKALGAGATVAVVDGFVVEPRWLSVHEHVVEIEGLPSALEGFCIAQITDAHLSRLGTVEDAILDAIRKASAQLVVLTGDLIDKLDDGPVLAELCAELGNTGATVLATLGNWEHWGNIDRGALTGLYTRSGATLLVDTWHSYDAGLSIYASDDWTGGKPRPLVRGPGSPVELLLTHSPAFVDEIGAPPRRFDLCLAGHTHGGQGTLAGFAPFLPPGSGRFVAGWYETDLGPLYVSKGTGTSIVPARFCCRPELPLFRLTRA